MVDIVIKLYANASLIFMAIPNVDLKFIFKSSYTPEKLQGYIAV